MITITETVHKPKPGRLEPTYVRYHVRELEPVRFQPIRRPARAIDAKLRPQVAALYGTNASPRDRMRHGSRWDERKMPIVRYTTIDRRWR